MMDVLFFSLVSITLGFVGGIFFGFIVGKYSGLSRLEEENYKLRRHNDSLRYNLYKSYYKSSYGDKS